MEKEGDGGRERENSAQSGRDQAWLGKGPRVSGFSQAHLGGLNLCSDPKLRDPVSPRARSTCSEPGWCEP